MTKLLVLVAGPYRSGTHDEPALIARNMALMNQTALAVYRRGHLPVCGEWLALPLLAEAGSERPGDAIFNQIFHPVSTDLLHRCDAVLRVGGPSAGADEMVRVAQATGKIIVHAVEELP